MTSPLGRLVLNPDVTVRSRGVMEKCNLCVQRIQLGKNQALLQRRPLADGDIATACQQACPTGAIVFGDLAGSRIAASRSCSRAGAPTACSRSWGRGPTSATSRRSQREETA